MSLLSYLRLIHTGNKPRLGTTSKLIGIGFLGVFLGKFYGTLSAEEQYSDEHLIPYENEDQLDYITQQTRKPTVVLYSIGSDSSLWLDRKMMRKYSHICKDRANFCMVNIAEHLMYINTKAIDRFPDPDNVRVIIKRPLQDIIATNAKGETMEANEVQTSRHFAGEETETGWRKFLESEGIIPAVDHAKNFLRVSASTVFS